MIHHPEDTIIYNYYFDPSPQTLDIRIIYYMRSQYI